MVAFWLDFSFRFCNSLFLSVKQTPSCGTRYAQTGPHSALTDKNRLNKISSRKVSKKLPHQQLLLEALSSTVRRLFSRGFIDFKKHKRKLPEKNPDIVGGAVMKKVQVHNYKKVQLIFSKMSYL